MKTTRISLIALAFALLVLRIVLWPVAQHTNDMELAYVPWQTFLIEHGRWHALRAPFGDYFPSYYEMTALTSYLDGHLSRVAQVKLVSFTFDVVASIAAYFLARGVAGRDSVARLIAPFCILAGPTVILNSAVWGQCDIVYTSFLILTVAAMIAGWGALAVLLFGVALACKLQAIFLCPFLLAMLLQRRIRWHHFLLLPVGWIVSLIPPFLNGASIPAYLSLPSAQGNEFSLLSIDIGNIYVLAKLVHLSDSIGLWIGVIATLGVGVVIGLLGTRPGFQSAKNTLLLACGSLIAMPYIMPRMHDRYFFPGEVLLCILACVASEYALPSGLLLSGSLLSYACYFQPAYRHWAMGPAFLVNTLALVVMLKQALSSQVPRVGEESSPQPVVAAT